MSGGALLDGMRGLYGRLAERCKLSCAWQDSEITASLVEKAYEVKTQIRAFTGKDNNRIISLGQNCTTAWYMKAVGIKDASYPFDWIFSSAQIVHDCLENDFEKYLDTKHIRGNRSGRSAGHEFYHSEMFKHRNPLRTAEDYAYYTRCVDRFREVIASQRPLLFICTLLKEPEKRRAWSSGFRRQMIMPSPNVWESYRAVILFMKSLSVPAKYLFIEQFTEYGGRANIAVTHCDDVVMNVSFSSVGENTGLSYSSAVDDRIARIIYSALAKST